MDVDLFYCFHFSPHFRSDKSFLTYRHKIGSLTGLVHGILMWYFVSVIVLQKLNQVHLKLLSCKGTRYYIYI